ncbi:MAG: 16S rRNA (adenine(1518)-N(6)/adenine(1519)-N(6))-dimethyltransferase RsmA [Clostridia bacterium]|nr:16S rRNA (adenine(1518)-N(6)/adenine(1519)-N(6))-dimethyltransferase RsmA [Clostridia bacterium]
MDLYTPTGIIEIIKDAGFTFSKQYGQNFLINEAVVEKIADAAVPENRSEPIGCVEIGPGIGSLTAKLAERFDKVVSIEIDKRLIPILEKTLCGKENVRVFNEDALKVDFKSMLEKEFCGMSVSVCANLPYYITSEVIMRLLESGAEFDSLVLMMQKEVAQRLAASPGQAEYGSVSAAVNYYASVKKLFDVQAGSFMPRPKVTSTVIRLSPYNGKKPVVPTDERLFLRVIRASFAQRRKTLLNSLESFFKGEFKREKLLEALNKAGIDPGVRGETLTLEKIKELSEALF